MERRRVLRLTQVNEMGTLDVQEINETVQLEVGVLSVLWMYMLWNWPVQRIKRFTDTSQPGPMPRNCGGDASEGVTPCLVRLIDLGINFLDFSRNKQFEITPELHRQETLPVHPNQVWVREISESSTHQVHQRGVHRK